MNNEFGSGSITSDFYRENGLDNIKYVLLKIGVILSDYNHNWDTELRKDFDTAVSDLDKMEEKYS